MSKPFEHYDLRLSDAKFVEANDAFRSVARTRP
jgi:hypothetical protein